MSRRILTISAVSAMAAAAALALPALGADDPPVPAPALGEVNMPPVGDASEDDLPTTPAERDAALSQLRDVVACVRANGQTIPDPVSDAEGVHVGWTGAPDAAAEAAIEQCDPALK
jgi:hypothetical protein